MKIKIAILINDFFFNYYETFYERLKNHSDIFECIVIATEGYSDKNKNSHAISEYLTSIEVENIDYKKGKKLFSLQEYKPDYVFYLVPYDCYFPKEYQSSEVSKYAKVCHISYGASMVKNTGLYESLKNNSFYDNASYIFVETNYQLDFGSYTKKFVPIGYMKLDKYFFFKDIKKSERKRKRIIWKPRWTLESDSNFWNEIENIYSFIKKHKELDFFIYYHPLFLEKIQEKKEMDKYENINSELKKLSNYFECEYSNFLDIVLDADILISDHSSTLVEFAATGKPIIYCASSVLLNDLGNAIMSNNYTSKKSDETIKILEDLLNGKDSKKIIREKNKMSYYFFPEGKESISNYLMHYIEKDYFQTKAIKLEFDNTDFKNKQKELNKKYKKLVNKNKILIEKENSLNKENTQIRKRNDELEEKLNKKNIEIEKIKNSFLYKCKNFLRRR